MLALAIYAASARLVSSRAAARPRRVPRRAGGAPLRVLAVERDQGGRRRGDDRARLRLGRGDHRPLAKPQGDAAERARRGRAVRRAEPRRRGLARGAADRRARRPRPARASPVGPDRGRPRRASIALLSIPSIAIARSFIRGASGGEITSSNEVANLGHPLDALQVFGIWPATDFRERPHGRPGHVRAHRDPARRRRRGLVLAWRRRAWGMPLYLATGVGGFLLVLGLEHVGLSSPWLNAKAMAEASPALVAAGVAGAAALLRDGPARRGGGDRRCDRGRRALVERARVLGRVARAAAGSSRSCRASATASPARGRR